MKLNALLFVVFSGLATLPALATQDPLASRTLIVYATNSADSVAVKNHYVQARFDVPSTANLCPITLPDPAATILLYADYVTYVKTPVQSCLNSIGKTKILYIVLAYVRPYTVQIFRTDGNAIYSLDSYLADVFDQYTVSPYFFPGPPAAHRYYADFQNLGQVYPPFQSFAAYRASARSLLIYSVWRLDGSTSAIANGLVDKAIANTGTLAGAACIDETVDPTFAPDVGYRSGDWDLHRGADFLRAAGFAVTEEPTSDEFGTGGAPAKCPADGSPVALYSGWYALNHYNGASVFNWAPGAIGTHLDSASALDPRSGLNWSANALNAGIAATSGAVNEPYLEGMVRPAGMFRNLLEGANIGDAFLRNTRWVKWMIVNIGDPLYRPFPSTGRAPFNPPAAIPSLSISTRELVGGFPSTGTVTIPSPAPAGGTTFALTSGDPTVATTPASVTVPAGSTSASFSIATLPQTNYPYSMITATSGAIVLQNSISAYPLLGFIQLNQPGTSGGNSVGATLYLNGSAPAGGITVNLQSSDPSASVPASIFIPAGQSKVSLTISTLATSVAKPAVITATYGGVSAETTLNILPVFSNVFVNTPVANSGIANYVEVILSVPAPAGGAVVSFSSNNPAATSGLPPTVTIPAQSQVGFAAFTTGPGPATASVTVTCLGQTTSVTVTIN